VWNEKEQFNADQGLYDSLFHAQAAVGLNTSAFLEAGILGTPALTIVADEFAGGQERTLHFHYLRAANGGLLQEARGLDEHVAQIAAITGGGDASQAEEYRWLPPSGGREEQIRRFIEAFVRPRGAAAPVTPLMVEEIERAARLHKRPRRQPAWSHLAAWIVRSALISRRVLTGRRAEARA
jgi:hypothetical protein